MSLNGWHRTRWSGKFSLDSYEYVYFGWRKAFLAKAEVLSDGYD